MQTISSILWISCPGILMTILLTGFSCTAWPLTFPWPHTKLTKRVLSFLSSMNPFCTAALVSVQRCSSLTAHGRATISNHFSLATQTTSSHVNRATIHRQFRQFSVWQLYADTFEPSQSSNYKRTTLWHFSPATISRQFRQFSVGHLQATVSVWQLYADNFFTFLCGNYKQTISSIFSLATICRHFRTIPTSSMRTLNSSHFKVTFSRW